MTLCESFPIQRGISYPLIWGRLIVSSLFASSFFFFFAFLTFLFSSVQFSCSVMSNSLRPHESQHARPPCPSPTPGVHSDSRPSSQWCHPAIYLILCRPLLLLPPIPPSIRVFSNESTLCMRWPKYWSFSFSTSPSKEIPGLISFRKDWILQKVGSPCSPRDSQESSPTPQFKSINSVALSFLHSPTLAPIYDHWKNHSLD